MQKVSCAERIRVALAVRDMKQVDLCNMTGIKKSAMSQYCSGAITPRQEATEDIARALNVSIPWLMGYDVPMEPEAVATPDLTPEEAELLEIYRIVNDQGKTLITANARMIRDMEDYRA